MKRARLISTVGVVIALAIAAPVHAQTGWEGVRECESGGDYGYNDGQFQGAYNFDQETWQSVGGQGTADQASPAEQDARAQMLYDQRGSDPWPNCGGALSGGDTMSTEVSDSPGEEVTEAPPTAPRVSEHRTALTG